MVMRLWLIPLIGLLLSLISLITLRSVAPSTVASQLIFIGIGLVGFGLIWRVGFEKILAFRWPLYLGLIGMLSLTLMVATATRGSARWLSVGDLNLQSSQLAVIIVGLVLAKFLVDNGLSHWKKIATALLIVAVPAGLIVIAPDLGTFLVFGLSMLSMIYLSNIKTYWLFGGVVGAVLVGVIAWSLVLAPYQKQRLVSFVNPSADIQGAGYNARQALLAVGSGQLMGRGLGQGIQSHLRFLPERHTDFVFASLAEEWGFLGAGLVILLYALLVTHLVLIAFVKQDPLSTYFLTMTAVFIAFQTTVNIGMNMQLVPITGLTLPLLSYGGSSFVSFWLHLGLAQSLVAQKTPPKAKHFA